MVRQLSGGVIGRLAARLLIVVFTMMSPAAMHWPSAAEECQPAAVTHDADAHRFVRSETHQADSGHCWLCHWARAFRSDLSSGALVPRLSCLASRFLQDSSARAAHLTWARIPARAPPAALIV
jgi:hypothetical protein